MVVNSIYFQLNNSGNFHYVNEIGQFADQLKLNGGTIMQVHLVVIFGVPVFLTVDRQI